MKKLHYIDILCIQQKYLATYMITVQPKYTKQTSAGAWETFDIRQKLGLFFLH